MKPITAALIGIGNRGLNVYGEYSLTHLYDLVFTAAADPNAERRKEFAKRHNICSENLFSDWEALLEKPQLADAVFICTHDKMHFAPATASLEKGYHVLLEKPVSTVAEECIKLGQYARDYDQIFSVCHVLRYTPFFSTIKKLLVEGKIGDLMTMNLTENVGYWHYAHSFVRGNWRNALLSSPMILQKSCHDMDILWWFARSDCKYISSFGGLDHFTNENAPHNAPERCLDGCPHERSCPYHVSKIYLGSHSSFPASVISIDKSLDARVKALKVGPYGRCVYHCDNDVVDHQVVNLEFENHITAVFTMTAFTQDLKRTIKLVGTKGEIRGDIRKGEIELNEFGGRQTVINVVETEGGHSGGDEGLLHDFINCIRNKKPKEENPTWAGNSVQSHLMAFAAEKSRLDKKVIRIDDFRKRI